MVTKEAIDRAIQAHGKWKLRLKDFINGSELNFDLAVVSTDNNCEFGKWIYGDSLTEQDKNTDYYSRIKALHADFHRSIKDVADLVLAGKRTEALKMITDFNGSFSRISTQLTLLLVEWEKTI